MISKFKKYLVNFLATPVDSFYGGVWIIAFGIILDTLPIGTISYVGARLCYLFGGLFILTNVIKQAKSIERTLAIPQASIFDQHSAQAYYSWMRAQKSSIFRDPVLQDEKNVEGNDEDILVAQNKNQEDEAKELQTLLLNDYYAQGLRQSSISFNFSILSAIMGFIVILVSAVRFSGSILDDTQSNSGSIIGIVSGTIIEAASILFFQQSNQARKLMVDFSEKLRDDSKLRKSLLLIDKIEDESTKSKIQALVTLNFAGMSFENDFLRFILSELDEGSAGKSTNEIDKK